MNKPVPVAVSASFRFLATIRDPVIGPFQGQQFKFNLGRGVSGGTRPVPGSEPLMITYFIKPHDCEKQRDLAVTVKNFIEK